VPRACTHFLGGRRWRKRSGPAESHFVEPGRGCQIVAIVRESQADGVTVEQCAKKHRNRGRRTDWMRPFRWIALVLILVLAASTQGCGDPVESDDCQAEIAHWKAALEEAK
jgi:hypothetical protein